MADKENEKKIWQDEYPINSYHADASEAAPLPMLCKFMQETAYRHAGHLHFGYEQLREKGQFWVLSRMSIKINRYPVWGERIRVRTWPTGVESLFAYRDFRLLDEKDRELGPAGSAWLILDQERHRPQRMTELQERIDSVSSERALPERPGKLPALDRAEQGPTFPVRYSDLDLYRHVNNASYIQWVLDTYSLEMHQKYRVSIFEINFLSEAMFGDEISILSEKITGGPGPAHQHSVKRKEQDRELCRARILWQVRD